MYGVSSNAGGRLEWLNSIFVAGDGMSSSFLEILRLAASAPVSGDGLLCLPYLHGERSSVWDSASVCAFVGLRHIHGREHIVRAALENAAFNVRQVTELIANSLPAAGPIIASGGPTRLRLWNKIKANVLHTLTGTARAEDPAALDAAASAAAWVGLGDSLAATAAMSTIFDIVEPSPRQAQHYDELYPHFAVSYPKLAELTSAWTREEAQQSVAQEH